MNVHPKKSMLKSATTKLSPLESLNRHYYNTDFLFIRENTMAEQEYLLRHIPATQKCIRTCSETELKYQIKNY